MDAVHGAKNVQKYLDCQVDKKVFSDQWLKVASNERHVCISITHLRTTLTGVTEPQRSVPNCFKFEFFSWLWWLYHWLTATSTPLYTQVWIQHFFLPRLITLAILNNQRYPIIYKVSLQCFHSTILIKSRNHTLLYYLIYNWRSINLFFLEMRHFELIETVSVRIWNQHATSSSCSDTRCNKRTSLAKSEFYIS